MIDLTRSQACYAVGRITAVDAELTQRESARLNALVGVAPGNVFPPVPTPHTERPTETISPELEHYASLSSFAR